MMNAKRSSNLNLTRYAFLMPVVVICLLAFSLSNAGVVKASPAFKAVAATVKNIKEMTFGADTTPVSANKKATNAVKADGNVTPQPKAVLQSLNGTVIKFEAGVEIAKNDTITKVRGGYLNDSTLIIVDGKVALDLNNIDPKSIKYVSVIKNNFADFLGKGGLDIPVDKKVVSLIYIATRGNDRYNLPSMPVPNAADVAVFQTNKTMQVDTTALRAVVNLKYRPQGSLRDPLVIIDGKEVSSVHQVDPNIIESVTILKEASSTSLYGEKGKYGVVIITTNTK